MFGYLKKHVKSRVWPYLPSVFRAMHIAKACPAHYPDRVFLEPTTRCNLGCLHCGRTHWKSRSKTRDLAFDVFKRIATDMRRVGVKQLSLQNLGEPLMHPRFLDMVDFAKSLGFVTYFSTNLSILTPAAAEHLVRIGHDRIQVSIDSFDPCVFDDLRRGTNLDTVMGNLRLLCETKKRLQSAVPWINVSAVLMRATLTKIPEFVAEMKRLGVQSMGLQELNTDGLDLDVVLQDKTTLRENALANVDQDEVRRVLLTVKALSGDDFPIAVPGDCSGRKSLGRQGPGVLTCSELWETSNIDSAGLVTPCCWLPDGSIINLGDLNKQSFQEVWHGERYNELRRQHLTNRHPGCCRNCQQLMYTVAEPSRFLGPCHVPKQYANVFLTPPGMLVKSPSTSPLNNTPASPAPAN